MSSKKGLIIGVIALIALGGSYLVLHKPQPIGTISSSSATNHVALVGKPAPDLSVKTIDGQQFSLTAYRGKPVVIFAMFNCSDCASYAQSIMQLEKTFQPSGLSVIGLDIVNGESSTTLGQFKQYANINFPLAVYNKQVVATYHLTIPDMTYVINKDGVIANINQSPLSYSQLKQQIEQAI